MKILDAHNHWMPPDVAEHTTFFKFGWSDSDALLKAMDTARIERAVLLYPSSDAHVKMGGWGKVCEVYNPAIAAQVKQHPDRFIGAGIIPADSPKSMAAEVDRIKDLGLSCLSLSSSYDGRFLDEDVFAPVLERAEKHGLPIFVHSQIINPIGFERVKDPLLMPVLEFLMDVSMCSGRLMMSGTYAKFPKLKFVFAHFAGVMPFVFDRLDSTYTMLRGRNYVKDLGQLPSEIMRNIFVDTSGVKSPTMIRMALETFGASQILWGSDYPAQKDMIQSIRTVQSIEATDSERKLMLGGNLLKVLG